RALVRLGIGLAQQRLRLKQWLLVVDLDRPVGCGQPQIDEERPEPPVRLDDALVTLVCLAAWKVHGRTQQEAPAGRSFHEQSGPDLDHPGEETARQERRRKAL